MKVIDDLIKALPKIRKNKIPEINMLLKGMGLPRIPKDIFSGFSGLTRAYSPRNRRTRRTRRRRVFPKPMNDLLIRRRKRRRGRGMGMGLIVNIQKTIGDNLAAQNRGVSSNPRF